MTSDVVGGDVREAEQPSLQFGVPGGVDFFGGWRAMLSGTHTAADIDRTIVAFSDAIDLLRAENLIP